MKYTLILLLPFLLLSRISYAQDSTVVSDFELWTGISAEKSFLENKLSFQLTEEFRFDQNSTRLNNFFTELEGKYEIFKGFSAGLGYRFIINKKNSGDINQGRFNIDLGYKHKVDRLQLNYRFRFQSKNQFGVSRDEGDYPEMKYRLKLQAKYNIRNWKLDPYVAVEGFYSQETNTYNYIESITETEKISGFEKLRFTIGTSYDIKKWLEVGAFYRIEQEFKSYPNVYNTPGTYYIGGLNLKFNL